MNAVTRTPDTTSQTPFINTKSEDVFLPYEGKGIRHIFINQYGFEKTFTDTAFGSNYFGTKILNYLHRNSREWVIRDNLFIKEKTKLNAYVVADNERFLRSLDFIQDARILVKTIANEPDSIDLLVITKDLFSITFEVSDFETSKQKIKVGDANVLGMGQQLQFTALHDNNRNPAFGYEILYKKTSIGNTFVNATLDYSKIRNNLSDGSLTEHDIYLSLDRPLVSQYSHSAGGLTIGNFRSENDYSIPDTSFYNYSYNLYDAWVGYNLGVKKYLADNKKNDRKFVSIRYFNYAFNNVPFQIKDQFIPRFNNRQGVLAQFTFFKQNFYKTNYIYGFGTTEDVPYGYNVALTTGWYKQLYLSRPYIGVDANEYIVTNNGAFFQYFLRSGMFLQNHQAQDVSLLLGTSAFSKLYIFNRLKLRQYFMVSYTRQFNNIALDPLKINNTFGLRNFSSDVVSGDRRISMHSETFFFLNGKIFGFQFAPFAFGDATALTPQNESFSKSNFFYGLGGGIRTRNENLVFGTMELRFIYFPHKLQNVNSVKVEFTADLKFRYNTSYVREPDIIQLNSDYTNSIY
ncbi:MAG: hypothetical protein ACR2FN_06930 [Chitinophagaceae bacterium]